MVKDIMCGDEAAAARSMLQITYPVWLYGKEGRASDQRSVLTKGLGRWRTAS